MFFFPYSVRVHLGNKFDTLKVVESTAANDGNLDGLFKRKERTNGQEKKRAVKRWFLVSFSQLLFFWWRGDGCEMKSSAALDHRWQKGILC